MMWLIVMNDYKHDLLSIKIAIFFHTYVLYTFSTSDDFDFFFCIISYRSSKREIVHIARWSHGNSRRPLFGRAHRRHTHVRRPVFQHELHRPKRMWTAIGPRPDRRTDCLRYDTYRTQG